MVDSEDEPGLLFRLDVSAFSLDSSSRSIFLVRAQRQIQKGAKTFIF